MAAASPYMSHFLTNKSIFYRGDPMANRKNSHRRRVRVATSDGMEQMIILGHGAERMSATELKWEVEQADEHLHGIIQNLQP